MKDGVSIMKELTIPAQTENLDQVLDFVNGILEEHTCSMYVQMQLDIAVEELFVNIAHYAYTPDAGQAIVQVSVEDEMATIVFIDSGIPYNPWAKEDPDTTLPLEERQIGGLGIYMVKNSMDEVDYVYKEGKNVVTIKKNINDSRFNL